MPKNGESTKKSNGKELMVLGSNSTNKIISAMLASFQEKIDFAVVVKGKKPTLLIPGADKILFQFNLMAVCKRDIETMEMLKNIAGLVAFVCELIDRRTDKKVGEGRGAAVLGENENCKNPNSTIKMAEIRATRDAVLRTFPLRDRFTQDMEDSEEQTKISVNDKGEINL